MHCFPVNAVLASNYSEYTPLLRSLHKLKAGVSDDGQLSVFSTTTKHYQTINDSDMFWGKGLHNIKLILGYLNDHKWFFE